MNKTTGTARNYPSSPQQKATVRAVLDARSQQPGALLPILHDIQDQLGYIPADVVADIAEALNVSRAEVHGVITYYHHFRSEPAQGAVVQVCRAEACQSCGSEALWEHASKSAAGHNVTLEPVYCLGLCATAPAVQIRDKFHARVTPTKFDRLLAQLKEAA
ncbi:formate dehydrogenase subunit gamma [Hylemonella gracilis]|uniref:Formate dehydrogenase subunit gamma n=1 Tax=Hylemonella gracilis TaxID=80880 RepID=A0A4P6UNS0_9BURK|nr:NAD(P)H-dependent oxidoreductase subunit E [Hylemonella gracilis]QBK05910.1 formate dehydrogenase subunit gamma [Hylemonella gracilis]